MLWNILFIIFTILFIIVALNVEKWNAFWQLRMRFSVPLLFARNQIPYFIIEYILLIFALLSSFFITFSPWYIGLIILVVIWHVTLRIAVKNAFNEIREKLKINKTDEEFLEMWKIYNMLN